MAQARGRGRQDAGSGLYQWTTQEYLAKKGLQKNGDADFPLTKRYETQKYFIQSNNFEVDCLLMKRIELPDSRSNAPAQRKIKSHR